MSGLPSDIIQLIILRLHSTHSASVKSIPEKTNGSSTGFPFLVGACLAFWGQGVSTVPLSAPFSDAGHPGTLGSAQQPHLFVAISAHSCRFLCVSSPTATLADSASRQQGVRKYSIPVAVSGVLGDIWAKPASKHI